MLIRMDVHIRHVLNIVLSLATNCHFSYRGRGDLERCSALRGRSLVDGVCGLVPPQAVYRIWRRWGPGSRGEGKRHAHLTTPTQNKCAESAKV